jgi:putative redox protein
MGIYHHVGAPGEPVASVRWGAASERQAAGSSSRSVSSTWRPGPLRCEVAAGPFRIPVDEPESVGGTGAAPQPTDLLLASAASCFTLAFVHSAAKRGIPLTDLRVDVVADYAGRSFSALRIGVAATGPDPQDIARLLESAARACYVTNTLRSGISVEVFAVPRTEGIGPDGAAALSPLS